MCGIVGLMSLNKVGFNQPQITIMEQMLYADQLRGPHGTGIFYDNRKGESFNIRGAMPATVFLKDKGVNTALTSVYNQSSFVIGHNRWATRGAHTNDNTHPFCEGNITLIHNGTVNNHRAMKDVAVDSHAICHSFAEKGAKETIATLDGAFAFVWYDSDTKLLHFIRNKERPLSIIKGNNIIAIASEPKMAEWVLDRNNEKVTEVIECVVGRLYTFNPDTRQLFEEDITLCPPKPKQQYPTHYYPRNHSNDFNGGNVSAMADWYRDVEDSINSVFPDNDNVIESTTNVIPLNNKKTFTYNYGDTVRMTPLAVDAAGKGWKLSLIVKTGIDGETIYALFYCNSKMWVDKLLDADTVTGKIIQTRYKGKECSIIVKEANILRETPAVDAMSNQFNTAGSTQLLLN